MVSKVFINASAQNIDQDVINRSIMHELVHVMDKANGANFEDPVHYLCSEVFIINSQFS
jgi:hypothetical protein